MPIPMQCECGHHWAASDDDAGHAVVCMVCGEKIVVTPAGQQPGAVAPPMASVAPGPYGAPAPGSAVPYGYALAPPEPLPPRGLAITGGILALLGGLGHAFIGFMLLVLAAFLAAFIHALFGDDPSGADAKNEAFGIIVFLIVYTGLSTLSCVPAILATMGRYWAVLVTAIFHAMLTLGLVYLTVRSKEWIVGSAAGYSALTLIFCVLGLRQAREYGAYLRRLREGVQAPASY